MNAVHENEGIRVQVVLACSLCGDEGKILYQNLRDRLFGAPGTWNLVRCPGCGLVWLNPRPLSEDIGKLYIRYHTHQAAVAVPGVAKLLRFAELAVSAAHLGYTTILQSPSQRVLGRALGWVRPIKELVELDIMTLKAPPEKLLDVGSGSGHFLTRMRELGWDVVGVEPDGQAARTVRESFGLDIHEGVLEEAGFPDDSFDAVTMNHVIEHVPDPVATLHEVRRVLRPGGRAVVVTPNAESMGHRSFGEAWRGLEVPRHFHLFSPGNLKTAAERADLRVVNIRTTARSASWMYAASGLIRKNGVLPGSAPVKQGLWLWLGGLAFWLTEEGPSRAKGEGEEVVMVAAK